MHDISFDLHQDIDIHTLISFLSLPYYKNALQLKVSDTATRKESVLSSPDGRLVVTFLMPRVRSLNGMVRINIVKDCGDLKCFTPTELHSFVATYALSQKSDSTDMNFEVCNDEAIPKWILED